MDFMKVLDQTVRDIKREVNLKVLKVPEMEQKVLDATSNEPWGPHGSTLAEIAQATKKFTECQMIMNVLWTRLADTGPSWRHVYKALAVIEYLVANGSERAVDDILEHTFQISSISGFKYVEPNGKDVGNNVRKKVETILALLDDKEKIQAVRDKAAANRDKFFGLSSTGITYNSRSALHDTSSYHDNDRYGGLSGAKEGESFKDSYKDRVHYGGETDSNHGNKDGHNKSQESLANENEWNKSVKGTTRRTRDQGSLPSSSSKPLTKPGPVPSAKSSSVHPTDSGDDFDDFDPRGSSNGGSAATSYNQVDLFGQSLLGDLMDAPTSIPPETGTLNSDVTPEVDLFADATFISASPQAEGTGGSHAQGNVDLFASQPAFPAGIPSDVVDFFTASGSGLPAEAESTKSEHTNINSFDSFAAVQLENSEGSDLFGAFTSHSDPMAVEPSENYTNNSLNNLDQTSSKASKPAPKKDTFQVKSGIWADSLSRGLIDLNITASKKTSLVDIGIVGGLGDGYDDKGRGGGPATSAQVGRAIGAGSGLGRSGFTSSTVGGNGSFSTLGQQQFGSFK